MNSVHKCNFFFRLFVQFATQSNRCVPLDLKLLPCSLFVSIYIDFMDSPLTVVQVARVCTNCGVNMGDYFCDKCKFYDDDVINYKILILK